jgi:hypothetical protein
MSLALSSIEACQERSAAQRESARRATTTMSVSTEQMESQNVQASAETVGQAVK